MNFPVAVTSLAEYKYSTRNYSGPTTHSGRGTSDVDNLARKVLKECQNNQKLLSFYSQKRDPESTYQSTSRQKKTHVPRDRKDRGRAKKKQRQKSNPKRRRRARSESSCSTSSKSSSESENSSNSCSSN
ncbi:MAG: hypothetical protein [Anelloviridae sp.]|nr:MAG: hypothetical protein [Anelloviridae sp.]